MLQIVRSCLRIFNAIPLVSCSRQHSLSLEVLHYLPGTFLVRIYGQLRVNFPLHAPLSTCTPTQPLKVVNSHCAGHVCGRMVMNFTSNKHYPIMISNWILRGNFIFHITSTWLNTARFYPGKVRTEVVFSLTECVLQQLLRFIMGPSLVLFIRTLFHGTIFQDLLSKWSINSSTTKQHLRIVQNTLNLRALTLTHKSSLSLSCS